MAKGSALRKPENDTSSSEFAALLDESLGGSTSFEGSVVKGTVIRIANDFVTIDVGLKSEGRVALREFSNGGMGAPEVKEGDIIDIFVDRMENKEGEAVLSGSEAVRNWTKGARHKDIPEPEKVWRADLDFAPRSIWNVGKDGAITRIPLARTPNWKVSNPDDVKKEWWVWDNPGKPFGNTTTNARGQTISLGIIREE